MLAIQSIEAPSNLGMTEHSAEGRPLKPKTLPCKYCSKRFRYVSFACHARNPICPVSIPIPIHIHIPIVAFGVKSTLICDEPTSGSVPSAICHLPSIYYLPHLLLPLLPILPFSSQPTPLINLLQPSNLRFRRILAYIDLVSSPLCSLFNLSISLLGVWSMCKDMNGRIPRRSLSPVTGRVAERHLDVGKSRLLFCSVLF